MLNVERPYFYFCWFQHSTSQAVSRTNKLKYYIIFFRLRNYYILNRLVFTRLKGFAYCANLLQTVARHHLLKLPLNWLKVLHMHAS